MHGHQTETAPSRRFDVFLGEVMDLYHRQEFGGALALLTEQGERYAERAPTVLYLRACFAARVHDADLAIRLLREAADRGFWYGERTMRESPSFQPLQGLPAFEDLASTFIRRHAAVPRQPRRLVLEPAGGDRSAPPWPAMLALHGNGDTAANALEAWRPVVDDGWLLAALQSSQAESTDGYVWDDPDLARAEIQEHYRALTEERRIDAGRVVLAGFSMGGATALRLALDGSVPVGGFVLLGPAGPPVDDGDGSLPPIAPSARGLRGYVILDSTDVDIPHAAIRALVDKLNAEGIRCHLETISGVGHGYPADLAAIARRALAFVSPGAGRT